MNTEVGHLLIYLPGVPQAQGWREKRKHGTEGQPRAKNLIYHPVLNQEECMRG